MKMLAFIAAGAAFAGICAVQPAQSATFFINAGLPIIVPPTQTYSLGRQVTDGLGAFEDLYEFTLGSGVTLSSSGFQSTRLGDASNLDFLTASLYSGYGTTGALIASFVHGAEDANGQETESLGASLLNAGQYTILLRGNVTADSPIYNGNIAFAAAAVPEPATWFMMVFGFAGIGYALRSNRQKVAFG